MNAARKIIVIGTTTGGLPALEALLAKLPPQLPAAVLITMLLPEGSPGVLEEPRPPLPRPARFALDKELISAGKVLVAPPGKHLLIDQGRVNLLPNIRGSQSRPAIDPFFRSAAISHRRNAIGVVLTGDLDDGTVGLQAIKACGGVTIVQDPAEALAPSMPSNALQYVDPHYCLPILAIAQQLVRLIGQPTLTDVGEGWLKASSD